MDGADYPQHGTVPDLPRKWAESAHHTTTIGRDPCTCTQQEPVSRAMMRPDHSWRFLVTGTRTGLLASDLVGGKQTRSRDS
jgi:hypothetical protein